MVILFEHGIGKVALPLFSLVVEAAGQRTGEGVCPCQSGSELIGSRNLELLQKSHKALATKRVPKKHRVWQKENGSPKLRSPVVFFPF